MRFIGSAIVLFGTWLLMSGIYKPMIVGFGAASTLIVLYFLYRMDKIDKERVALNLNPVAFLRYIFWLLIEIAKSTWNVTKIVVSPDMPINQHMFRVPYTQKSDLGQVIFANSITLTPGTITVETEDGEFLVHAVDYAESDMEALADMDRRVSQTEGGGD